MSTITVTNIKATGETASRAVSGVAAAWASFDADASGTPFFDSFNASSITDNDTGIYILNFSNSMANDDYVVTAGNSGNSGNACAFTTNYNTHTTSATGVKCLRTDNQSRVDCEIANMVIHGDLA